MSTVLIVDDDPAFTHLVAMVLQDEGFRAWQASDGEQALKILEVEQPDLILLDLNMPNMDGRSLYKSSRARGYKGPVVIVSAIGAERASADLGADGALEKPFDINELVSRVNGALGIQPGEAWLKR